MPRHKLDVDTARALGGKANPVWSDARAGAAIVFCDFSILETIVKEHQAVALVWPEEGDFNERDQFVFNERHRVDTYPDGYEPLLCDIQTANVLVQCIGVLSDVPINKEGHPFNGQSTKTAAIARLSESRAYFAKFVDVAWRAVK